MGIISERETTQARPPRGPKTDEKELKLINSRLTTAVSDRERETLLARKRQLEQKLGTGQQS